MKIRLDAHQWHLNGDHPEDEALPGREGRVVRRFRHPDHHGSDACPVCHGLLHHHGWIDSGGEGHTVCPGDWIVTTASGRYPVKTDALFALCRQLVP